MKTFFTYLLVFTFLSSFSQQDPWQQLTGDMPTARANHSMVDVNGSIYVFGGASVAQVLRNMEKFNRAAGLWDSLQPANPPEARQYHAASAYNGKMYVFGGQTSNGNISQDVFEYDPEQNSWSKKQAQMPMGSVLFSRATTGDDAIWITGGYDFSTGQATGATWYYEPGTDEWTQVPDCPEPRYGHTAFYEDGNLYVAGGRNGDEMAANMWMYKTIALTWEQIPTPLLEPLWVKFCAYGYADGTLWMAGGTYIEDGNFLNSNQTWEYIVETNTWNRKADLPYGFYSPAGCIFPPLDKDSGYEAIMFGGKVNGIFSNETWIYNSQYDVTAVPEKPQAMVNIKVRPLPAEHLVRVESSEVIQKVEVFDTGGRRLLVEMPGSPTSVLDLNGKPSQLYILLIKSNGITVTKKVVL